MLNSALSLLWFLASISCDLLVILVLVVAVEEINDYLICSVNCFLIIFFVLFQEEEFLDIIKSSERIEYLYDHLFDETIVNSDLTIAFGQLLAAANRIETEPNWVPASWVQ